MDETYLEILIRIISSNLNSINYINGYLKRIYLNPFFNYNLEFYNKRNYNIITDRRYKHEKYGNML